MDVLFIGLSISLLTLAGLDSVVKGNHGKNLKKGSKNSVFIEFGEIFIIVYTFIFMSVKQKHECMRCIVT